MVGVPRSQGCLLCVKRRVKCDQTRPACGNCTKYGAECPGYDRTPKFVAGKHKIRPRQKHEPSPFCAASSAVSSAVSSSSPSSSSPSAADPSPFVTSTGGAGAGGLVSAPAPFAVPAQLPDNRAAFVSTMIENIWTNETKVEFMWWGPWFTHVPAQLGRKVTLDSAMCAMTLHMLGKARADQALVAQSRQLYGQSLTALQVALNHPDEWRSSETLCATMLLCYFELFAETSGGGSWMSHARGVAWLMQQRGPDSYLEDWDKSMLFSFRSMIVMGSLFSLEDCFLAKKKWQRLLRGITRDKMIGVPDHVRDVVAYLDLYMAHLARLPTVLKHGYPIMIAAKHGMPVDSAAASFLKKFAWALRNDLLSWFKYAEAVLGAPREVPSTDPISPYPTVFAFDNLWYGAVFMGYWTSLLVASSFISLVEPHPEWDEANRTLARNIFRSFESVSQGIMGPYRVGFSMRISYDVADVPTQRWIRQLLDRMSSLYGATNADVYPPVAPNDFNYS